MDLTNMGKEIDLVGKAKKLHQERTIGTGLKVDKLEDLEFDY